MTGIKILICDDTEAVHETIGSYLTDEGMSYLSAFDGEEAIKRFNDSNPDLILLDLMMPKLFGTEVCKQIRKVNNVPIIMLTAKGEEIDKLIGLEIGADDYIVKPFSPREVVARIKTILRRVKMTRESNNKGTFRLSLPSICDILEKILRGEIGNGKTGTG